MKPFSAPAVEEQDFPHNPPIRLSRWVLTSFFWGKVVEDLQELTAMDCHYDKKSAAVIFALVPWQAIDWRDEIPQKEVRSRDLAHSTRHYRFECGPAGPYLCSDRKNLTIADVRKGTG